MDLEIVFRVKNVHQQILSTMLKSTVKNIQKLAKYFNMVSRNGKNIKGKKHVETCKTIAPLLCAIQDFASVAVNIFLHCGSSETLLDLKSTLK